ncbi:diguanylate cyclase [Vibrio sinaloensis]|uniref:diguanylate cyclase domain-containing protein n=1 Tax=Photobacterium sp. (strain ATCC 43367) TaxID=379097 RepID=UPI00057F4997|nr:diguanylate cyclase [Vibrio sinaloensis]KIE22395.1 diguanylate cyclase [Vibrio sinaloensis]
MISARFTQLPLRYKMILPTWFMVMFIVLIIGTPAIHLLFLSQREAQEHRVHILSQGVASTLQAALMFDDPITAKEQLVNLTFDPDIIAAKVINEYGETITSIHQLPTQCQWTQESVTCADTRFQVDNTDIFLEGEKLGTLVVWESLESIQSNERRLFSYLGALTVFISLLSLAFAQLLHGVIVKPLTALHSTMERMITQGIAKSSIDIVHDDEVGKLTRCFNEMIANLLDRESQLQSALQRVEQKNRYIHGALDAMKRGVLVVSPGNKINYGNPVAISELMENQSRLTTREMLASRFEPKTAIEQVIDAIERHQPLAAVELRTLDGQKCYRVSCHPMEEASQSLLQFQDVTSQNLSEQRRKLLELMFDQNQDAIFVLDRDLNVTTQNTTSLERFGVLSAIQELVVKKPLYFSLALTKTLLNSGVMISKTIIRHTNQTWSPYRLKAKALKSGEGRVEAFVISLTDLTLGLELERLSFAANHDTLTGLANRSKALKSLQARHRKGQAQFIFFLDLDGFKAVNDQYGHGVGDELLRIVAKRLTGCISAKDLVARIAGDEFLIAIRSSGQCQPIAQRIIDTLAVPIVINEKTCQVTASIGISYWAAEDEVSLDEKIDQADRNMYVAKRLGKNRFYYAL